MAAAKELEGKVAIVTGASRNIGRSIALSLAAGGAAGTCLSRFQRCSLTRGGERGHAGHAVAHLP